MDISYTNVLEGARQYFQGLPSPALSGSPSQPLVLAPTSVAGAPHAAPDPPDARYDHVAAGVPTSSVSATTMPPQPAVAVASTSAPAASNALTYWPPIATASPYQRKELTASPQVRVSTPQSMQHSKTPTSSSFSSAFNGSRGNGEDGTQSTQQSSQPPPAVQRPQGHNLPPIAALSNYHSSRSSSAQKTLAQPVTHAAAAAAASSKTFQRVLQSEYTLPRQNQAQYVSAAASGATRLQYGQQGPKYQQIGVVPSSASTPTPTPAPAAAASTSYHSFPSATSSAAISSTPASTPSAAPAPLLSSQAPPQPHYAYHPPPGEQPPKPASRNAFPVQAPYYSATPPSVPHHGGLVNGHQHQKPPTPAPTTRPTPPGGTRVKRESPLDLSVKTVRQSADSTADDSEGFGSRSYASPAPPPTHPVKGRVALVMPTTPGVGGYPPMQGAPRVPTPRNVGTPAQSVGAPKIELDFVSNFSVHQQQQQQHGGAPGTPHYGQQDSLQRPKERLQPYPQQQSSSSHPQNVPHMSGFKPIGTPGAYNESKPSLAAYNHSSAAASGAVNHTGGMPYDPKQVQPPVYNHKMPTQPTPLFDKYGPFPTYTPNSEDQPVASKAPPQQPSYEHKPLQPGHYSSAYPKQQAYEHKLQQSAAFDYNKKVQQPNIDHKQALQSSYDQNKHANVLKYEQKPVVHGLQAHVQSKPWEHKKQASVPSFDYKSGPPQLSSLEHKAHAAFSSTPQQRLPGKAPPTTQPYGNHQFPAAQPPVPPGGYDPSKRPSDLAAGYPNNRPSYRPLPNNTAYPNQAGPGHKRPAEQLQPAPSSKVPRVNDTWRQTIDQEIEQRFSSYTSSRLQQSVNGNAENTSTSRQEAAYLQRQNHVTGQHPHPGRPNPPQQSYNQHPVAGNPQYPSHQQHPRGGASLPRMLAVAPRTGRNRAAPGGGAANKRVLNILRNTLEEKEARMTQLQNQLQHNAQLQQQYQQRQPQTSEAPVQMMHHQKPAVSPTLPPGRHNLPPHGAGLENSHHKLGAARDLTRPGAHMLETAGTANTQALLADITRQQQHPPPPPPPVADLEGFAAYLAARIRTKGELKQVGPSMEQLNSMHQQHFRCPTPSSSVVSASNSRAHSPRSTPGAAAVFSPPPPASTPLGAHDETAPAPGASAGGSPPKLTRERVVVPPPRRRLFSRPEEEMGCPEGAPVGIAPPSLPLRDSSGLRSSSETSVFDFRDSDSEGEMPVLERQTLNEMRKDRRLHPSKQAPSESGGPAEDAGKEDDYDKDEDELDPFWSATCESFVEQLRTGVNPEGPKRGRGRRKKTDEIKSKPVVLKREEAVVACEKVEVKQEQVVKVEAPESSEVKVEVPEAAATAPKEEEPAEETAMAKRRGRLKSEDDDGEDEMSLAEMKARLSGRRESDASSDSDASEDEADAKDSVVKRLRTRKGQDKAQGMKLRSKESPSATSTPRKTKTTPTKTPPGKGKKKPSFGDGSDFAPGWEEQVYLFKRSLRMPARLINIPRPRDANRLCASLPDLDPCPGSPAAEFPARRGLRWADADSDLDSASNLSTPLDSEDATSSSLSGRFKAKDKNNLLNIIVQKYSQSKVERNKSDKKCSDSELTGSRKSGKVESESPPKANVDVVKPPAKKGRPFKKKNVKEEQTLSKDTGQLRRFRKKSATTFREAFLANGDTFALKSRTRRQTQLHQRTTLREVFGEERPASAPPACGDDSDSDDDDATKKNSTSRGRSAALARSNKAVLNSKRRLLQGGRRRNPNLIRALASKTLLDSAIDLDAIGDDILAGKVPLLKKRMKLRNVRRKFRSGFDYIRKKKKPIKKDVDSEGIVIIREKQKRQHTILRPSSESVQDIQNEIRGWVINKGLGETLLHRAARLGYTDVAAYCLEKLDNPASPRDNAGYTPLHEACSRGHMDIARLLLMYGANVSDGAVGGVRPLHEATENGFVEMMRLLLSYGADPLLATYSGQTPLAMANDEDARRLLQLHLADVQGQPAQPWYFQEYASCDRVESGFNVLQDPPCLSPEAVEDDDVEMELSDMALPVLYRLRGDSPADRWVLLQDLTSLLRAKSKDSLLRQLSPEPRNLIKELKMADFLEQARCCHLLGGGERINVRASKVALVPYNDKVREMLGVEKIAVSSR